MILFHLLSGFSIFFTLYNDDSLFFACSNQVNGLNILPNISANYNKLVKIDGESVKKSENMLH